MYKQLYKDLIERAKSENRSKSMGVYYESHHIVPEFMFAKRKRPGPAGHLDGDPNATNNLVLLTFREHLMAHYYLYEILKNTKYEHKSGSALQFFFTHATGNHRRQRTLSELDEQFLQEMSYLRELGIESISKARRGNVPVVDAITRETVGSVPVDHPNVVSGKWVHHTKGRKYPNSHMKGRGSGSDNNNYKQMTVEHEQRIFQVLSRSTVDGNHLSKNLFESNLKKEFSEFKKISIAWIIANFGSIQDLVAKYNSSVPNKITYSPHYRSNNQRSLLSNQSSKWSWLTDGKTNMRVKADEVEQFIFQNSSFRKGRTL